jgi:hypothetical protein
VFQFHFAYHHLSVEEGVFTVWLDVTSHAEATPHHEHIATALRMLTE